MRGKRVTGRFFLFLLALAVIAFLIIRSRMPSPVRETVIRTANASQRQTVQCVIIRDEPVQLWDATARVEYMALENSLVAQGDTVANIYTTGYSETLLDRLEATRSDIQKKHKEILNNIVDPDLNRYDTIVNNMAMEFKDLVTHKTRGNLQAVSSQLETAMVRRQDYLRQNKREDNDLTNLYATENARMASIQSWRKACSAEREGVISFYLDGYENDLTVAGLDGLTISDVRTVLDGGSLAATAQTRANGVYRIVDQDKWYVAVLADGSTWTPVVGQDNYYMQFSGYEDLSYTASVHSVLKENGTTLAIFEINDPIGALIYERSGGAQFSITLENKLAVDAAALASQGGQTGVWKYDVPGGTFVPVEVLSSDGSTAIIQPLVNGALRLGDRVLIK